MEYIHDPPTHYLLCDKLTCPVVRWALLVGTHEGNLLQRELTPLKRALDSFGDAGSHGDSRKQVSLVTGGPACRDCHRPSRGFLSDSLFLSYLSHLSPPRGASVWRGIKAVSEAPCGTMRGDGHRRGMANGSPWDLHWGRSKKRHKGVWVINPIIFFVFLGLLLRVCTTE